MKNENDAKLEIKNYLDNFNYDKNNKYYNGIEEILKDNDIISVIYDSWIENINYDNWIDNINNIERYVDMLLFDMCELRVFERFYNTFTDNLISDGWKLDGCNFIKDEVEESGSDLFWELLDYKSDISENLGLDYEMWLEQ
jgi:hypothetical protein